MYRRVSLTGFVKEEGSGENDMDVDDEVPAGIALTPAKKTLRKINNSMMNDAQIWYQKKLPASLERANQPMSYAVYLYKYADKMQRLTKLPDLAICAFQKNQGCLCNQSS